jgi:hypothetical protein
MDSIILYLVIAFVAFVMGWKLRGLLMIAAMSDDPEKIINMLKEVKKINESEASDVKVEVEPEKVNGHWYAYAKETGQFLAQGSTLEEALKIASIRFPNKTFWCETLRSNLTKST